ncbi:MAG: hypothetical protein DME26_18675, partial [Verrucomicrobia bacterium]
GSENSDSYLLALEPATGKELWRVVRPSEAHEESLEAYSTPMPYTHNGRTELIITGGDSISGHDPATGKEIWRWGTWNPTRITHWRLVPSPVAGGGVALACAPKGSPVYALKLDSKGTLTDTDLAWTTTKHGRSGPGGPFAGGARAHQRRAYTAVLRGKVLRVGWRSEKLVLPGAIRQNCLVRQTPRQGTIPIHADCSRR